MLSVVFVVVCCCVGVWVVQYVGLFVDCCLSFECDVVMCVFDC